MSVNFAYHYAEIENASSMCIGVVNSSVPDFAGPTPVGTTFVEIPVYDEEYCFKYYNWDDGRFYYDEAYTQEYVSPLL